MKSEEVKTKSEADVLRTRIASLITDPGGDDPQRAHGHEVGELEGADRGAQKAECGGRGISAGRERGKRPPTWYL